MSAVPLDPARQQQAREYARIRRRLLLVDLALAASLTLLWLFSGASAALARQVAQWTANEWLAVALFGAVFGATYVLADLPLGYYGGYLLAHHYGLSTQTRLAYFVDVVKGLLVSGVLGLAMLEVIYAFLRAAPDTWWLWTAAATLLFGVVLSNLAPVLILPLFYKLTPLDNPELVRRLTALAEKARARVNGVFTINFSSKTTAANAALMGLGNTRRIVLGDTLYGTYSADEIETILAHELAHHVNRDIPLSISFQAGTTLAGLWLAHLALQAGVQAFGFAGIADLAALPLFGAVMGAFGFVIMPLGNAFSRWRERLADQYALENTRNPDAFIAAMTRLANQNLAEVEPEPWVEFLLYSHPSIGKRIAMARAFAPRSLVR